MDKREIFEKVKKHLLTQRVKSMMPPKVDVFGDSDLDPKNAVCAYRGYGGMKCAVGILIADKYYNRTLEGKDIDSRLRDSHGKDWCPVKESVAASLDMAASDMDTTGITSMLRALQVMHDNEEPWHWERVLDLVETDHL